MELVEIRNNQVVVSSRQVAEKFGKEHRNVLASIKEIINAENSAMTFFQENTYKAGTGKSYPEYLMNRDGFTLLAMSFTGKEALQWKMKYIQAFNEMEKRLQSKAPTTLKEALILALEQQERIEQLEQQRELDKPKVEFYNEVTESDDTMDMQTVAKVLNYKNIGRNKLFEILRANRILRHNNQPFQKYIDMGWFKQVETKWTASNGDIRINVKTVVFQKGLDGIRKILRKEYSYE